MSIHSLQNHADLLHKEPGHLHQQQMSDGGGGGGGQLSPRSHFGPGGAIHSRHIGTIEQGFVIIECYRLKEKLSFDKRDMQLLFQVNKSATKQRATHINKYTSTLFKLIILIAFCIFPFSAIIR
jgi:hypothetical protein